MIGRIRATLVLIVVTLASLAGIPLQMIALRTGFPDPGLIPHLWHRMAVRLLGIRIHVRGRPAGGRPLLLVANHISWTDIPVLSALMPLSFVAKSDMITWPVFGLFARLQRSVFVERDRARTAARQAGELGERLAAGEAMALFAEGTTADGNSIVPFKSTLVAAARTALASETGKANGLDTVFVQPVTIAYTRLHGMPMGRQHRFHASWIGDMDLVPHLGKLIREGAIDVEVHFAAPIVFTHASDRKQITREIEATVRATMAAVLHDPVKSDGTRPSAR